MATASFTLSGTSPAAPGSAILGTIAPDPNATFYANLGSYDNCAITSTLTGATGGPLDVYVQFSPDQGTTWIDIVHYTQIAAAAAATTKLVQISRVSQAATITATGDAALAAGTALTGTFGDRLRVKMVAGALTTAGAAQTVILTFDRTYGGTY